ncbi:glutathione S-transferase C-terminal domain-containing protein isoform X1 [Leucoraja erinacea]|uniref:glutathione S-transferase C-terminal domain-containing protein isoform X1 n=1 Tax=Leucoraja erinaceus TaxID=7782 RepID=UPI0024555F6A|nr:glutathione S-transferase C-terminal domain-containing protein isoform X1 [Leucoraja erinacea]
MKKGSLHDECLYLELSHCSEDRIFPLHTSIVFFLMSYCDTTSMKVFLVPNKDAADCPLWQKRVPANIPVALLSEQELPPVVRICRLPAVVESDGNFCRAGLAVVLRHIIQRTYDIDSSRKDVLELLGFKKTCLKACAEVSQWTKLCEISIPLAVENFIRKSIDHQGIPPEMLHLENKLGEPVHIHNDDKIRRQKLRQRTRNKNNNTKKASNGGAGCSDEVSDVTKDLNEEKKDSKNEEPTQEGSEGGAGCSAEGADVTKALSEENKDTEGLSLELRTALSKLAVEQIPVVSSREQPSIRKVKTSDLPPLEHLFAEGLFFTLTDIVLFPCLHYFFVSLEDCQEHILKALPLLCRWYQRVQEVPGVKKAIVRCDIQLLNLPASVPSSSVLFPSSVDNKDKKMETMDPYFRGGPRPTMTKLEENGISARFIPHPCCSSQEWSNLPVAVNPIEGMLSPERALRKQQQLDNIISIVTKLAKPGDTIVDFCSGGGHLGIVLAHTLSSCQVILVENKEESLERAKDRCDSLGLQNIWFLQANLDYFTGSFEIGVALHACGVATDMVIDHCIMAQAAFVVCPCCYGFIQNTVKYTFPRSQRFKSVLSCKEHMVLCRFADQTAVQLPAERRLIGKNCMGLVDLDRALAAEDHGYTVYVTSMEPDSCSPKNNLIVGTREQLNALTSMHNVTKDNNQTANTT